MSRDGRPAVLPVLLAALALAPAASGAWLELGHTYAR